MRTRAPRTGTVRTLRPAGLMDRTDSRVTAWAGHRVRVVQPYGCPRNGTMGMCFVESAATGEFIGLVSVASITQEGQR